LFLERNPKLETGLNSDPSTYLVLRKDTDVDQFNTKFSGFIKHKDKNSEATIFLQRYSEKYLHNRYENGKPAGGRMAYVTLFSIVALFHPAQCLYQFHEPLYGKSNEAIQRSRRKESDGGKTKDAGLSILLNPCR